MKRTPPVDPGDPDSPPAQGRGSITRKTLKSMSLRIALVIVVTTTVSYFHMVETLKGQSLSQVEKYVTERGHRERMAFRLAEDNHAILKHEILKSLEQLGDSDPVQAFDALFIRHPDGVTRNRPGQFDGTQQTGVYIDADLEIDADIRRRVLTFYRLCNSYGPAWHNRFQDTYITTPENIMAIYWPEVPTWCQDAGTDLYMPDEEYVWVADVAHNPERDSVWTGLFYDHIAKVWMVSCETPVDLDGRHIATIGHDITLNELVERTLDDKLEGTFNMIFRGDGRLIAHPDRMKEIQEHEGYFDIAELGDEGLKSIVHAVESRAPGVTIIDSPENDAYLAVTTIDEPGWYFVTVYPKSIMAGQAMKTASFILVLGIASLLIEVTILFFVLRRQVASRLNRFLEATTRIAGGRFDVELKTGQDDELGRLANSFNTMAQAIEARDMELAQRREQLEEQVAQRTETLELTMHQLDEARRFAEEASKSKSEFLANMSHEIRTPMTAILGYADLLDGGFASDPQQASDAVRTIQSNANHLLTVINDILDVSKIEAGQMAVEAIATDPIQIVQEVVPLVGARAKGKGIHVLAQLDSPVPEHIHSDPTRLRQILLNLVGNAIKFTEVGSVTIHISCDPPAQQMQLRVVDTGIGMSPEQCEVISRFEAFSQADASTTRKFGGTGLGLRISNALAQMLGGGIEVASVEGQGSTFTATIATGDLTGVAMLQPEDALASGPDKPAQITQAARKPAAKLPLKGLRVLLAEDGPDNQRLIRFHLNKAGAEVIVCENGLIAAQTLENANEDALPDVVLMDMQMPELDGYSATQRLRDGGLTLPIIALTAHAMEGDRRKCLEAGCVDYLTKPIDKRALIQACLSWSKASAKA